MWSVIFPVGTGLDSQKPDKLDRSQSYADSLELLKLNHVLIPHRTGFETRLYTIHHVSIASD